MDWAQVANTLIFVFGTFISILEAIWLSRVWAQELPDHKIPELDRFAHMAVRYVEQRNKALSGTAKKQLAASAVLTLFQSFKRKVPSEEAIDIAIEAAVFGLSESKELATYDIATAKPE
jgi:Bacteriophage holin of superfamily 6 (Holin_LLH)